MQQLEGSWELLAARNAIVPMQDPQWSAAAATAFRMAGRVEFEVIRDGEEVLAVAPLLRRRGHLELLGARELYEPADLLATDPARLEALCVRLMRRGLPLVLHRVPGDSPSIGALRSALGARGRLLVREAPGTPMLELGEAWTELGGGLSSRRRSDLRRALRRAEAQGELGVRILHPDPGEVPALLDEAFAVEARSWKGAAGTALTRDPRLGGFFRDYASRLAGDGRLELSFLDIGERPAAMQLAVVWHNRLWTLKIGYDEAFARSSPGILLLAHIASDATRRGLTAIEFLGSTQPWLDPWTTAVRPTTMVAAYPLDPRAVPGLARDAVAAAGRPEVRAAGRRLLRAPVHAAARSVHSRYIAGPTLADAVRLESDYAARGYPTLVGYWNLAEDPISFVMDEYRGCIDALAARADAQVSIKATAIGETAAPVAELLARAAPARTGVHLDAMAPETQDTALAIACELGPGADGLLGCTLTGRWPRSVADASRVAAAGLRVRVVKSEWPSPDAPDHDPRAGFIAVVEALRAAGAMHVAVATHDAPIARRALELLLEAGVPCEHQVLHGMPASSAMKEAAALGVTTRIFTPYGHGRLPYSARAAVRDPRAAARLARDLTRRNRPL